MNAAYLRQMSIDLHRNLVAKGGLREFIRLAWPEVETRQFITNWHIDVVAEHLEAMSRVQIRNLIINIPPGSGKSKIVSVLWPAWEWTQRPGTRYIYASFDPALSRRDAGASLDLLNSQWFLDRWGFIADPNQAILDYENVAGGWRYGTSVRGKVTGRHADIRVFDDPVKPLGATKKGLEECIQWWTGTMGTRIADPATSRYCGIMQRIHDKDLSGYLIDEDAGKGEVEVLRLPMRYESRNPCVTSLGIADPRTEEGELLNPQRYPEGEVAKLETTLGPVDSAAQLQQRPTPEGGNIFLRSYMQQWIYLPQSIDQWFQSWDMAFKGEEDSDFVAGGVWARSGLDYFLVMCLNKRLSFVDTLAQVQRTSDEFPQALNKVIENKANGPAVVSALEKKLYGLELVEPEGGKVARANAVSPIFRDRHVWFPANPMLYIGTTYNEVVKQLIGFPKAANDDLVDMISQGLTWGFKNQSNLAAAMTALQERMRGQK